MAVSLSRFAVRRIDPANRLRNSPRLGLIITHPETTLKTIPLCMAALSAAILAGCGGAGGASDSAPQTAPATKQLAEVEAPMPEPIAPTAPPQAAPEASVDDDVPKTRKKGWWSLGR